MLFTLLWSSCDIKAPGSPLNAESPYRRYLKMHQATEMPTVNFGPTLQSNQPHKWGKKSMETKN